jgi:hypothetical protein
MLRRLVAVSALLLLVACAGAEAGTPAPSAGRDTGPSAPTSPGPLESVVVPEPGDCGWYAHGTVDRVGCADRRANAVVVRMHLLGDPQVLCPLFTARSVLVSYVGDLFFVCWEPKGGGPERIVRDPEVVSARTPPIETGVCGYFHQGHLHSPLDCADVSVNRMVSAVLDGETDPAACPKDTAYWVQVSGGWLVCWAATV